MPVYREPPALGLAFACGVVAAVAFTFTDGNGTSLVDSVLGLKQGNPLLRGLFVGLTVLVLIRSKLSSIKGAEIGGELAYNSGRVMVMQSLNLRWRKFKNKFNGTNLGAALFIPDPHFESRTLEEVRAIIGVQPEEFRVFVESQIRSVQQSRPSVPFDPAAVQWQTYYRTLINLALDYAGSDVFAGWTNFRLGKTGSPPDALIASTQDGQIKAEGDDKA
jgi:hypothetical protein